MKNKSLAAVGIQPTPPKRLVPKTSALDHSATLPDIPLSHKSVKAKATMSKVIMGNGGFTVA